MSTDKKASHTVSISSPAKINLYFDILNRRDDGYHEIETIFQAIDLQDILIFKFFTNNTAQNNKENNIRIALSKGNEAIEQNLFPLNNNNSLSKAIEVFTSALSKKKIDEPKLEVEITVKKNIPIGAGLAGGSANAAAALLAMNHYFAKPFSEDDLLKMAAQIGSDVAFCLLGGMAIGKGRGEELQKLSLCPQYHFVLVKPRAISISTPWAYKTYDQFLGSESCHKVKLHAIESTLNALRTETALEEHARFFGNVFERVIFKEYPLLARLKKQLLELGCISVYLTGSGPTIFGLVENEIKGQKVLESILNMTVKNFDSIEQNELTIDAWLTKSIDRGVQILQEEMEEYGQ